jgi:hypothetical protein
MGGGGADVKRWVNFVKRPILMGPPRLRLRNTTINEHAGGDGRPSTGGGGADAKLSGHFCEPISMGPLNHLLINIQLQILVIVNIQT